MQHHSVLYIVNEQMASLFFQLTPKINTLFQMLGLHCISRICKKKIFNIFEEIELKFDPI